MLFDSVAFSFIFVFFHHFALPTQGTRPAQAERHRQRNGGSPRYPRRRVGVQRYHCQGREEPEIMLLLRGTIVNRTKCCV